MTYQCEKCETELEVVKHLDLARDSFIEVKRCPKCQMQADLWCSRCGDTLLGEEHSDGMGWNLVPCKRCEDEAVAKALEVLG